MVKLAVFDVDGTLLNNNNLMDDTTFESLNKLKNQGIALAIASGRPSFLVRHGLEHVEFDYYICSNGTYMETKHRKELFQNAFTYLEVEALSKTCIQIDAPILFQFTDASYVYHGYDRLQPRIHDWIGDTTLLIEGEANRHETGLPYAAVAVLSEDALQLLQNAHPDLSFEWVSECVYDVLRASSSKADALQRLGDELDISMDEVIAFGDNYNDMQMIDLVGKGVAMGNAIEPLKTISNYVTSPIGEGAIEKACQYYDLFR